MPSSLEVAALKAAIRLAKPVNPMLATLEEMIDIGSKPTRATLLAPAKMPIIGGAPIIKFSGSSQLTGAFGAAGSAAWGIGFLVSVGLYASNTPEVGVFSTLGGGIFVNTPGASIGGELTLILGTPLDFSGPYLGVSVSAGTGLGVTGTLLFSPTLPLTFPPILTLMGCSINFSAVTPTKLPLTVAITVTNTKISKFKI